MQAMVVDHGLLLMSLKKWLKPFIMLELRFGPFNCVEVICFLVKYISWT